MIVNDSAGIEDWRGVVGGLSVASSTVNGTRKKLRIEQPTLLMWAAWTSE